MPLGVAHPNCSGTALLILIQYYFRDRSLGSMMMTFLGKFLIISFLRYLKFGPYGSYVPTYDSRLNNLHVKQADRNIKDQTKEEHRLEKNSLLKTYGGELELLYVQSIQVC